MWQCPLCGHKFKIHSKIIFVKKPNSIDDYTAAQRINVRPLLQNIRETIHVAAPEATEKISWQMPTFWQGVKTKSG